MSSGSHHHLFFVLLSEAFFTLQNTFHPGYRKTACCNCSAMLFIYKKSREQEENTRCVHQILHRLVQRRFGPNHPALENYSWGYSAPSRQACAYIKRCSLSFGNCSPVALTATGHSGVAGLTALGWRWCLWKWTIRLERYKEWHPPFWEIVDLCKSGVGSSPVVYCVAAQPLLGCRLPLWKMEAWRPADHYSQEGGVRT